VRLAAIGQSDGESAGEDLKPDRVFGYGFDFGDDGYHQVQVERIEQAIPTVSYPRVIRRVGKSPPQYQGE
jgi:pRiA4b ORF-3-like protein